MQVPEVLTRTFDFDVRGTTVTPEYWQAAAIIFLIFLLVLSMARLRHMYVHWSLKGFFPTMLMGFVLAMVIEGLLIVGGKTLLTEMIGWENAPKPISTALDEGRLRLVKVLGVSDDSFKPPSLTALEIVDYYNDLKTQDAEAVKELVCKP